MFLIFVQLYFSKRYLGSTDFSIMHGQSQFQSVEILHVDTAAATDD